MVGMVGVEGMEGMEMGVCRESFRKVRKDCGMGLWRRPLCSSPGIGYYFPYRKEEGARRKGFFKWGVASTEGGLQV